MISSVEWRLWSTILRIPIKQPGLNRTYPAAFSSGLNFFSNCQPGKPKKHPDQKSIKVSETAHVFFGGTLRIRFPPQKWLF